METSTKVMVQITHEVKNFSDWKQGFDADKPNREAMGANVTGVFTSVENPNLVSVTCEVPSKEAAMAFLNNPDLKGAMEKAGVISAPEIKIYNLQ
jgi:hypothetical protein